MQLAHPPNQSLERMKTLLDKEFSQHVERSCAAESNDQPDSSSSEASKPDRVQPVSSSSEINKPDEGQPYSSPSGQPNSGEPDSSFSERRPDSSSSGLCDSRPFDSDPSKYIVLRYFNLRFPTLLVTTWNTIKEIGCNKHVDLKQYY